VASAALARQESRGGHYRADFTENKLPQRTFVTLAQLEQQALRFAAE